MPRLISLLILASLALADVQFIYPAAGASIAAEEIIVKWEDSGIAPPISALKSYTLQLMVGGNDPTIAQPLVNLDAGPGLFSEGNGVTGTVDPALAESLENGFYLQMISTAIDGGTVMNYSPRFALTGMTGVTNERYIAQVEALDGSTKGPATVNDVIPKAADPEPAGVDPGLAGFGIPYNKQSGPTKYAPMQPIPPTKITAGSPTPLYPTSAFDIARGKLPPATVLTTLTAVQTFKVQSIENTIAPQSNPKDAMAKFLARWKD